MEQKGVLTGKDATLDSGIRAGPVPPSNRVMLKTKLKKGKKMERGKGKRGKRREKKTLGPPPAPFPI